MQPFCKMVPRTPSEYFCTKMYLIRETFLRYKTNSFCLTFNHAKESVSSKKNAVLGFKTVSKKVKRKFRAK